MLTTLSIHNIVLVEDARVHFTRGFNVVTGETGAGKSALMRALALALGQRADSAALRQGADSGWVEAAFEVGERSDVMALLTRSGIEVAADEELIIRREISRTGKSRAFINNQLAQVSLLRRLGDTLVHIVSQHASTELKEATYHRTLIDLYGTLAPAKKAFLDAWQSEQALADELESLQQSESERLRELDQLLREDEEIQEARLRPGEEEDIFTEYTRLTNSEELAQTLRSVYDALQGSSSSALAILQGQQQALSHLSELDSALVDTAQAYASAVIEIRDVADTLRNSLGSIEHNPARAEELSSRLALIERLKKRYGPDVCDVLAYHDKISTRLETLQDADARIEELHIALKNAQEATNTEAQKLTQARNKTAPQLAKALEKQLRALNMPHVQTRIDVSPTERSQHGDDHVEIFFSPNAGEDAVAIKECASGGELSRLALALKALLAKKERVLTLVFDEIDANIGGETAVVVGEKLAELGSQGQVLSITHFPQVARQATHHVVIRKRTVNKRTVTEVQVLGDADREAELQRMLGGEAIPNSRCPL